MSFHKLNALGTSIQINKEHDQPFQALETLSPVLLQYCPHVYLLSCLITLWLTFTYLDFTQTE